MNVRRRGGKRAAMAALSVAALSVGVFGVYGAAAQDDTTRSSPSPSKAASLTMPPGVSMLEGAQAAQSVAKGGVVPAGARVSSALPGGKIVRVNDDGSLTISLAAPFGQDPISGAVAPPMWTSPRPLTRAQMDAVKKTPPGEDPVGLTLAEPVIFRCQVEAPGMPAVCPAAPQALIAQGIWSGS